jgi:transposase-like protein
LKVLHPRPTTLKTAPVEVVTDAAAVYAAVLAELAPAAWHHVEQYANNPVEADHSRLKHRLRSMRGFRTDHTARTVIAGHAFAQNLHRGHYELAVDEHPQLRVAAAFADSPGRSDRAIWPDCTRLSIE